MDDNPAMDAFLGELVMSKQFDLLANKNWDIIANMFPGVTPYQVQKRYKELKQDLALPIPLIQKNVTALNKNVTKTGKTEMSKDEKTVKDNADLKSTPSSASSNARDQGPVMVIHVCDEAKSLKQDFNCPRDLLVREMKYFAEYLSSDSQRWEDVDISVHCDVQIFDWLMKYVKRGSKEFPVEPELETVNVISILISSDFLKMESLIDRCIVFCHKYMNSILATPCNMNCINDKLVTRIAALFNHNEIEELKDRKDKFKSKLFAKKVEKLFDPDISRSNTDSPYNACSLFKCKHCEKLLTKAQEKKLKCVQKRMLVGKQGDLIYIHEKDNSWDVNDFLVDLKTELKTWREVYWRLWGTLNFLYCSRCNEFFQCKDFGGCLHHKDQPVYQSDVLLGRLSGAVGTYLCCGERTLRFDPTGDRRGCQVQDHLIKLDEMEDGTAKPNKVYDDLLAYRHVIAIQASPPRSSLQTVDVFANDEFASGLRDDGIGISKQSNVLKQPTKSSEFLQPKLQALTQEVYELESQSELSDDEVGDDEIRAKTSQPQKPKKTHVTVKPAAILVDGPEFAGHHRNKWDASRSVRFNQDAQRQEDVVRFRDMVNYLTKLRIGSDKLDKYKQKDYAGGIYAKLEAQWKASYIQAKTAAANFNAPRSSKIKLGATKG